MLRRRHPRHPAGFTLVELLIVITIVVILLALLLPAVHKIRVIGQETEARNEISQMSNAATTFKNDWAQCPPSLFRLPTRPVSTNPNAAERALEDASFAFLKQRYNRWPAASDLDMAGNINWANHQGMSGYQLPTGQYLQGNQCMVLFLGGPERTGWAHDRPAAPSGTAVSKTVYLEIKDAKLQGGLQFGYNSDLAVYVDPFGSAYVYFGSNHPQRGGKYNDLTATGHNDHLPMNTQHPDIVGGTGTVSPYQEGAKYSNEGMCQIICAGENQRFGPGGAWVPGNGVYAGAGDGSDDMSNFNNGIRLGVRP